MNRLLMIMLTVALSTSVAAGGKVFKWTDKDGKIHYGDQPESTASEVNIQAPSSISSPGSDTDSADNKSSKDTKVVPNGDTGSAAKKDKDAKEIEKICSELEAQIKTYESAGRLIEKDKDGNRRILTDDERKKIIADRTKQRDDLCSNK